MVLTAADLADMRAAQLSIMSSACVIRTASPGWVWDAKTSAEVYAPGETVYAGPCRIQRTPANQARASGSGGQPLPVAPYVGALPWDVTAVNEGHEIEITASGDPSLVGRRLTIQSVEHNGLALTARRFHAELIH